MVGTIANGNRPWIIYRLQPRADNPLRGNSPLRDPHPIPGRRCQNEESRRLPAKGPLRDGEVIRIQIGMERYEGGETAGHLRDVANLLRREAATQQILLPIGKPFLDDLIAADGVP